MVNFSPNFSVQNGSQVKLFGCNGAELEMDSVDVTLEVDIEDPVSADIFQLYCHAVSIGGELSAKLAALMLFMRMCQLGKRRYNVRLNTLLKGGAIRRRLKGSLETTELLKMLNFQPATRLQVSWLLKDLIDYKIKQPFADTIMRLALGLKRIKENRLASRFVTEN